MFWVGTSWKMNKTRAEASSYVETLSGRTLPEPPDIQLFLIPPFTAIETVRHATATLQVLVGAQNVHQASAGAFTGEVSAPMLAELGCDLVEIGHSERRALFGETDIAVNEKAKAILGAGMRPLICIGETAEERARDAAVDTVVRQARIALSGIPANERAQCLLAYEPVWAIGEGGTPATPEQAAAMHAELKKAFPDCPVLYGGSVNAENCSALASCRDIDGLFIGRAAWAPEGLLKIAELSLTARAHT